jgi:hypothetical protein
MPVTVATHGYYTCGIYAMNTFDEEPVAIMVEPAVKVGTPVPNYATSIFNILPIKGLISDDGKHSTTIKICSDGTLDKLKTCIVVHGDLQNADLLEDK